MNILLVSYWPIPHVGGVWPFMLQLKSRLENWGHRVDIMGNGADEPVYHLYGTGRKVVKEDLLHLIHAKLNPYNLPVLYRDELVHRVEIDRYCMELAAASFGLAQYDVIHAQDVLAAIALNRVRPETTGLITSIHGSLAREIKILLDEDGRRDSALERPLVHCYYRALEYHGAMAADKVVTSTHWLKNVLTQEYGVSPDHIEVSPYGLDLYSFQQKLAAGTSLLHPLDKKVIVCPARLESIKGIHYLIEALAALKQRRSDWVCWLIGDGDKREELVAQTQAAGLAEDILFFGYRDDVPAVLQISDIFVHPSVQDNQPFAVMEAQAAGKPAVVSSAGGLPEMVVHGETGFVSAIGDTGTLASHLELLLEEDALRLRMGEAARLSGSERWSLDRMTEHFMKAYLAAGRGRGRF
ncbi:glycosyltransferase family 4 protein [Paenibacillus sp. FJAT-26967]|uniref:glycosyltransferase family 4 protein n=1 Tax=Paenibacillus sp. FJAT-26967 TaxID=1729690 RepID=UPI0008384AB7|nr:glycosyltransferase family 4 protein [Paenibacillus sp. FJAT-26967]